MKTSEETIALRKDTVYLKYARKWQSFSPKVTFLIGFGEEV